MPIEETCARAVTAAPPSRSGCRKKRDNYPEELHFMCGVFQQTLQNVSNPLSIAHDSRVGDGIVA